MTLVVRFPAGTDSTEAELMAALGSPKVLPSHLPPEAINVDAPASFVTQHGYITTAVSGPTCGRNGYITPCLLGVSIVGRNQHGYITPAFSGSPWCHPYLLGVPIVGRNLYGYITPAFSGSP